MPVRYHESLQKAVEIAVAEGVSAADMILVRDGRGRIILCLERFARIQVLENALKQGLGGYAGTIPLITGKPFARLAVDPNIVRRSLRISAGDICEIRYIERRIVGSDWMRSPVGETTTPPRLVFGSIKGGVGRSTALSVLASDLARHGKSVLAIDLDLEAPGIGFLLLPENIDPAEDRRTKFGVVDYLVENSISPIEDSEIIEFIGVSPFANAGVIDVVPATGRVTDENPTEMLAKISIALVEDTSSSSPKSVADQLSSFIARLTSRRPYDAVLIDARAGMAEISAAPLMTLGAEILLFGTDQQQTFRGYRYLLSHLVGVTDFSSVNIENDWRSRLSFVHSKAPPLSRDRARFRDRLYDLCSETIYDTVEAEEESAFNFSPDATGPGIPHDALFIRSAEQAFANFDPTVDNGVLDPELYESVFGEFLTRAWKLLKLDRQGTAE